MFCRVLLAYGFLIAIFQMPCESYVFGELGIDFCFLFADIYHIILVSKATILPSRETWVLNGINTKKRRNKRRGGGKKLRD